MRRHQGAVRAWLRRLCRDDTEADELAQDTFVQAWQKLDRFEGRGRLKSWLFTLAYRNFLTRRRRADREQAVLDSYAAEVEEQVEGDESLLDIEPMLARLSGPERECLLLTHAWGMSIAETGRVLDMADGTVKSHVHRAKRRLAEHHALEA